MKNKKGIGIIVLAVLLSSCELLGIGGDGDKEDKKEQLPEPELMWESSFFGQSNTIPPIIEDSSFYFMGRYGFGRLSIAGEEGVWSKELKGIGTQAIDLFTDKTKLYIRFEHSLEAYSKTDGTLLWNIAFEDTVKADRLVAGTSLTGQADTHVFVGTGEKLLIINKQQGVVEEVIPEVPAGYQARFISPLASKSGDKFYLLSSFRTSAGVFGRVSAYSLTNKSLLWQNDLPFPLPHILYTQSATLQMAEAENNLVIMTGPAVIAFDTQTGQQAWSHLFYEGRTDIDVGNLLAYNNGSIYAGADARILKLDAATGQKEWEVKANGLIERLFVVDGNLYFSAGNGLSPVVYSVDAGTGERNFQLSSPDGGLFAGFTPAFDASSRYLVVIGVTKVYVYQLPE